MQSMDLSKGVVPFEVTVLRRGVPSLQNGLDWRFHFQNYAEDIQVTKPFCWHPTFGKSAREHSKNCHVALTDAVTQAAGAGRNRGFNLSRLRF